LSSQSLPIAGSIALHEGLGFIHVASYHEVGFKFGKYWDVNWYEKDVMGKTLNLRGINARVIRSGDIEVGDIARKV